MTTTVQTRHSTKPSGKFSPIGMLATFFGGVVGGIVVGLIFYAINRTLHFGIPLVFPALSGMLAGFVTWQLGSSIGRCRNPMLAIFVALVAGSMAWGTEHITDYLRFRADASSSILQEYPQAPKENINLVIDEWLQENTGQRGFTGFMLLKSMSSSMEITPFYQAVVLPGVSLNGWGLIIYWFVELVITASAAAIVNRNYAKAPYCDSCNAWRKYKTPIVGTDVNLEETIEQLQQRNISTALDLMEKDSEGNITHLEIEFCPKCYDSKIAKLVVVKDTGPKSWVEETVWSDKLEPRYIQQILESA